MFNRVKVALARCLCYRALELARDRKRRYWGTAHPRPEHGPLWPDRDTAGPVRYVDPARVTPTGPCHVTGIQPSPERYPASHSTGPPHVQGPVPPAPTRALCWCGRRAMAGMRECKRHVWGLR